MNLKERVVVVDDHPMFRDRLAQIINHEPTWRSAARRRTCRRAIEISQTARPVC